MGAFSLGHWLVVIAVVLIVFGAGRLPKAMGELEHGLRAFRSGLREQPTAELPDGPAETPAADRARG